MAYDLSGSGQYYSASAAAVATVPLTMAAWFLPDNITSGMVIAGIGRSGTTNHYFYLESSGAVSGDPVVFGARGGGVPAYAESPGGISATAWNHGAGVTSANNSRYAFLNGAKGSQNTSTQTPSSLNTTDIGMVTINTPTALFAGLIAEVGIWSVVLSDDEIASLAKGVAPIKVRPQSLVFYAPMIRNVQDVRGGLALTQTGSPTVAAHPRIYY